MKYSTPSSAELKNDGRIYRNEMVLKLSDEVGQLCEDR